MTNRAAGEKKSSATFSLFGEKKFFFQIFVKIPTKDFAFPFSLFGLIRQLVEKQKKWERPKKVGTSFGTLMVLQQDPEKDRIVHCEDA